MISLGRSCRLVGLLLPLLAGCASLPDRHLPGVVASPGEAAKVLAVLRDQDGAVRSLRAVARVRIAIGGAIRHLREVVALRTSGVLRLETLGALGMPVHRLILNDQMITIWNSRGGFSRAEATREGLAKLAGIEVAPLHLIRILVGLPPEPVSDGAVVHVVPEARAYVVATEGTDFRQRLTLGGEPLSLLHGELVTGRQRLRFRFSRPSAGGLLPEQVNLSHGEGAFEIWVTYVQAELNLELPDHLFEIAPPGRSVLPLSHRVVGEERAAWPPWA